jgi:IS30 family transposase
MTECGAPSNNGLVFEDLLVAKLQRRSLTWGHGLGMAKHKAFRIATDVKGHFCDPQSPWRTSRD